MGALKKHNNAKATTQDMNIFTRFICKLLSLVEVRSRSSAVFFEK